MQLVCVEAILGWGNVRRGRRRTPGCCEEEDVDAHECNTSFLCSKIQDDDVAGGVLTCSRSTENGDKQLTNGHSDG
jgi:hypothetical protein